MKRRRHGPGTLLVAHRFFEDQRLSSSHVPGLAEVRTPSVKGLELCMELARINDRVLVLTSRGHVGWTYGNVFEEVDCE